MKVQQGIRISGKVKYSMTPGFADFCNNAGPIAEQSKMSSDLGRGRGDPGSNLGGGKFF